VNNNCNYRKFKNTKENKKNGSQATEPWKIRRRSRKAEEAPALKQQRSNEFLTETDIQNPRI
jgi:hypothetical protein